MKTTIDNKEVRVVYIEYNSDNVPHEVLVAEFVTKSVIGPYWCLTNHFDFFANDGDVNDIRHYNSGGGGNAAEIQAPQYVDGYIGRYWIDASIASFKGLPINAKQLKHPLLIKTKWNGNSTNPFKVSEETYSREYCDECGHEKTEMCSIHQYEDNEGNIRYKHKNHH